MARHRITEYTPISSDRFFFDNNIWIYIFCPLGDHRSDLVNLYNDFFGKVLDAESTIFVSSLILSEYYNRYVRLDFNIWRGNEIRNFKNDYRPTDKFKETNSIVHTS